ncbi:MAG: cytochrome, partial [Acidobacteria bacterium]|nr:cytochrome [Acidobacteriota bacterium]
MKRSLPVAVLTAALASSGLARAAEGPEQTITPSESARAIFEETLRKMSAQKASLMAAARAHLADRYDLTDHPAAGVTMSRGKAVQDGTRVKLPGGTTWQQLAAMTPDEIRRRNLWPLGFMPLPHPNHPEGGMLFPQFHIDEVKRQTDRDLNRFDLEND